MFYHILAFFSDLILFTAGIVVLCLWIIVLSIVAIEAWDLITGYNKKHPDAEDEEDLYQ